MSANENAVAKEEFYGIDDYVAKNDFSSNNPNPDRMTNDDDFLNSDYPEDEEEEENEKDLDDEDLEDEAENSVDKPGEDFNETEESIEEPEQDGDYSDEEFQTEFFEDDPRRFSHLRV